MTDHVDPFEELAALFLTESEPAAPRAAAPSTVELVVVGSLPVRASLWLVPYADAVAREAGPTALVRLDQEQPTIQLLRAPGDVASRRWPTLSNAIADLGRHVGTWLIRPAYGVTHRVMVDAPIDRITVLTSVNDSAIVKAYQEIKLLAAATGPGTPVPQLGVAVLGSSLETAERFHRHLGDTTSSFLDFGLSLVACVPRMDATTRAAPCMTFPEDPFPALETVLTWVREATPASVGEPAPRAPTPMPAVDAQDSPPPSIKLSPRPRIELESKPADETREPHEAGSRQSLVGYLEEVAPLDVRCPGHEELELAVDEAGRIQVAAHEQDMRRLHVVAAWAASHAELIAKACPDQALNATAPPVLHVFTDRPASVDDLHGSNLRLHVLAPVIVEGRQGWYHARLNRDRRPG